jgi:formate dehydrogenase maturation protein FdhE
MDPQTAQQVYEFILGASSTTKWVMLALFLFAVVLLVVLWKSTLALSRKKCPVCGSSLHNQRVSKTIVEGATITTKRVLICGNCGADIN